MMMWSSFLRVLVHVDISLKFNDMCTWSCLFFVCRKFGVMHRNKKNLSRNYQGHDVMILNPIYEGNHIKNHEDKGQAIEQNRKLRYNLHNWYGNMNLKNGVNYKSIELKIIFITIKFNQNSRLSSDQVVIVVSITEEWVMVGQTWTH